MAWRDTIGTTPVGRDSVESGPIKSRPGGASPHPIFTLLLATLVAGLIGPTARAASTVTNAANLPHWIWPSSAPAQNEIAFLRRTFAITQTPQRAGLRAAADRRMTLFLNGTKIADVDGYQRMAKFDVTHAVKPGANVIALRAQNDSGPAGILAQLTLTYADGRTETILSDTSWQASLREERGWEQPDFAARGWFHALSFGPLGVKPWGDPTGVVEDYNQWKLALGEEAVVDPASLTVAPGFQVELLRAARTNEGSWVSLEFDPQGRLLVAREDRGLLRFTLPARDAQPLRVETINDTLLECRGLLWAHDSLFVNANNSKALFRLRSTRGDDRLDEVKQLRVTPGGVGHGRNDLALGPDGMIYAVHGNDVSLPADYVAGASPFRNFAAERLLPRVWDQYLEYVDKVGSAPAGHLVRTDPEGRQWEVVAGGFRNPYGLAFNPDGELFTYDADMEWDAGAPWYRPTRVNHVVSGADFGWRPGTGKWRAWYPDSLPAILDIGKGSPTGIKFGTRSHFPPKYQRALFILDWAYGRIFAVHLKPSGASYTATQELFLKGRPLNVTDLDFGPDGAMYFVTGGRKTQSALYRVRYGGPVTKDEVLSREERAAATQATEARALHHKLEAFHGHENPHAVETAWPHLNSDDLWIRHAARVAIEHQPVGSWQKRALTETRPTAALTALMALARVGPKSAQPELLARLNAMPWATLDAGQRLIALRACELCFTRMGRPAREVLAPVVRRLEALPADADARVNQLWCELLVYTDSPQAPQKALPLLDRAQTQEEQLDLLYALALAKRGWTLDARRTFFQWLKKAGSFPGEHLMPKVINFIRADALLTLSADERAVLTPFLAELDQKPVVEVARINPKQTIKAWQMADLEGALADVARGRSFHRGQAAFAAAMCNRCHRFGAEGTPIGPDLTDVAARFGRREILESILDPSKVVDEKYRNTIVETKDGEAYTGRIVGGDERTLVLGANALEPGEPITLERGRIAAQRESLVSPMPSGLLDTSTKAEILDLLAYLESGGDPNHRDFQP